VSYAGGLEMLRARPYAGIGGLTTPIAHALAPVVGLALVAGLHWVTLKNHRRVGLNAEGRVVAGLPEDFHGVHVGDVSPVSLGLRAIERGGRDCKAIVRSGARRTFKGADAGARELLDANPALAELLESDCSHECIRYRRWVEGGRRGAKPLPGPGDGRFDALNERLELKGRRRVASWLEAVHVTVPPSRRWADFADRLPALEEATGLRLELPSAAEAGARAGEGMKACDDRADELAAELLAQARAGRISRPRPLELEDAPF
jgi:hypothetical protein